MSCKRGEGERKQEYRAGEKRELGMTKPQAQTSVHLYLTMVYLELPSSQKTERNTLSKLLYL